nr:hypothetical protein [Angustibacter aerolatus]
MDDVASAAVRRALAPLATDVPVTVRVHPEDHAVLVQPARRRHRPLRGPRGHPGARRHAAPRRRDVGAGRRPRRRPRRGRARARRRRGARSGVAAVSAEQPARAARGRRPRGAPAAHRPDQRRRRPARRGRRRRRGRGRPAAARLDHRPRRRARRGRRRRPHRRQVHAPRPGAGPAGRRPGCRQRRRPAHPRRRRPARARRRRPRSPVRRGARCAASLVGVDHEAPNALLRQRVDTPVSLGVRALDTLVPAGRGQRFGIFAGSGVGKSSLLSMIARGTDAAISVLALVGERGREVREFVEGDLGEAGLARSVVVVATSDAPAVTRLRAAFVATRVAEWFRDQGLDVLLMMDSLTRVAMAQREIGLSNGEPPATRGYPPSTFALLPRLLERAGPAPVGSITGIYTVLVDGDDHNEPIADAARSILDGHVTLSRKARDRRPLPVDRRARVGVARGERRDDARAARARQPAAPGAGRPPRRPRGSSRSAPTRPAATRTSTPPSRTGARSTRSCARASTTRSSTAPPGRTCRRSPARWCRRARRCERLPPRRPAAHAQPRRGARPARPRLGAARGAHGARARRRPPCRARRCRCAVRWRRRGVPRPGRRPLGDGLGRHRRGERGRARRRLARTRPRHLDAGPREGPRRRAARGAPPGAGGRRGRPRRAGGERRPDRCAPPPAGAQGAGRRRRGPL